MDSPTDNPGQAGVQPVSAPIKEQEPLAESEEFIVPSETEPTLAPEIKEVGVKEVAQVPTLTLEDQKAGLTLAKESVPVPTQPSGLVDLPKEEKEAASFLKVHRDVKNAVVWLVATLFRQFRQAHEKVVGAKP